MGEIDLSSVIVKDFRVKKIPTDLAKRYIKSFHYSKGSHNAPSPCYGLFCKEQLIGACLFATPCSENVRASILGESRKDEVIELHRLFTIDNCPKNSESFFVARCLKELKKDKSRVSVVISFSDTTEGHIGTIYQACNAWYYGKSSPATFYEDKNGRLRHPHQQGENITIDEAKERGWKPIKRKSKHRYLWILSNDISKEDLEVSVSKDYPKQKLKGENDG